MNPFRKWTGTCRSCNAEIIWAVTPNDKTVPLDARSIDQLENAPEKPRYRLEEFPDGPNAGKLEAIPTLALEAPDPRYTYVSHFATCPHAGQHSRPRTSRAAAERAIDRGEDHA